MTGQQVDVTGGGQQSPPPVRMWVLALPCLFGVGGLAAGTGEAAWLLLVPVVVIAANLLTRKPPPPRRPRRKRAPRIVP